jgi:PAS domain S-box-containing protein
MLLDALRHPSEEVHQVVLSSISDAVFITDDGGSFTYICPNVKTIFGYEFEDVVGMGCISALLGGNLPTAAEVGETGEVENVELEIIDREGRGHTLLVNVKRVQVEQGTILYTCRDITERKAIERELAGRNDKLFEEVRQGRDKLRALAKREVVVQERERARISRELHDEAGQYLTALQIMVKMAANSLPEEAGESRDQILEAARLTDVVAQRIRHIAHGLRPPALDTVGIVATLAGLCREVSRQAGVRIDFDSEKIRQVSEDAGINLYRFLQEALTNAVKHANPSSVKVRLYRAGTELCLEVADDGEGFDPEAAFIGGEGLGLTGMKERMDFIGGTLEIESNPGCGARLTARLPYGGDE